MKILCHFLPCQWIHITNILVSVDAVLGLWQCRRCKNLSLGRPLSEEERRNQVDSEILKIRRITIENDEVTQAIKGYIEKHHDPPITFTGNEEITVKHNLTPGGRYLSAKVEIAHGGKKGIKVSDVKPEPITEEPTDAELEEHVKESAAAGEPIHPDQMMKDLMSGKRQ